MSPEFRRRRGLLAVGAACLTLTTACGSRVDETTTGAAPGVVAWLADTAPRAELEQWVLAQQTIAPAVKALCG